MPGPSLIDQFAALDDPRQSWKVLFPLPEVLLLVLCGTLAGAEDFVKIRRWGYMHQDLLRRLLPFKAGVPSLLTRKDNQSNLHDEVRRYLDEGATLIQSRIETTDGDHGRVEVRRHRVSHDVDWLTTGRRFPGEPPSPGLRAIAVVEAEVERNGSTSLERRYYLSSMPLDVVFHEGLSRLRSGAGAQNMAAVRHMAMNLLWAPKDKHNLKVRRKSAAWDTAYLEALLRQSA